MGSGLRAVFDAAAYYDALGDREWDRLDATVAGRVSFEVHRRLLAEYLRPGWRVLEVGAGPGRFTRVLAELGTTVVVSDISPVQLRLNADHLTGTPAEAAVEARVLLDVADTSRYSPGEFDAVVAYGGPLSYVFDGHTADALTGLLRITRPGQPVLASVMSLLGTWRHLLPAVAAGADVVGEDVNDRVLATGDLRVTGGAHACQMYRAREVTDLVAAAGAELLAITASNWASLDHPDTVTAVEADPDRWTRFLTHEAAACREPGALDGGTHILFAARTPTAAAAGTIASSCYLTGVVEPGLDPALAAGGPPGAATLPHIPNFPIGAAVNPVAADHSALHAVPDDEVHPQTPATAPCLGDDTVTLDAYRVDDVAAMQAGADPEIIRWINEGHTSTADEDAAAVNRWAASWATGGTQRTWAVRDRHTGQLLGGCELRLDSPSTAAFSYWIYPAHRGRGLAARAVTLVVDYAFTSLGVRRAELLIEADNLTSQRVAAAAGFQREGVLRAVFDHLGDRVDAVSWSRLPTDPPRSTPLLIRAPSRGGGRRGRSGRRSGRR